MTSPSRPLSLQSVPIAAGRHSQASAAYHLSSSHLSSSYPASYPMAATLEGHHQQHHSSSMMKLYGTNQDSWNTSTVYATTGHLQGQKMNAFGQTVQQQQQPQPQQTSQQLEQINFLVRKECCSEIDQAISELGISLDPYNWNISDVQKWLLWMQQWLQLPAVKLEHFHLDGYSLCQLSEDAFRQRTPGGEQLYAKLEIWRMAINYFRPEAILDTLFGDGAEEQQQQSNQAFSIGSMQNQNQMYTCASPYASSSSESSLYGSPISPEGYGLSSCNSSLPTYAESVYGTSPSCGGVHSPASPASSSHSSSTTTNCPSPYGQSQYTAAAAYGQMAGYNSKTMTSNNNNGVYGQTMDQMMTLGTVPPTSDYGSDAIPSDDDDMSDDEKCFLDYQHRLSMQQQQQQQPNGQPIQRSLPVQIKLEPDYPDSSVSPVYQQHQAHMLPPGHYRAPQSQYQMPVSQISVKSEMLGTSSTTPIAVAPAAATAAPPTVLPPPPRTSSSSHIHLWQFLKELLSQPHQFGSCIRWLDRSKGVFKIEDSVRVAKLWGARKNRPAMNYDKLSRSIRQYYKKGIMKKTERSQRLVYQFCTPYSL